MSKKPYIYEKQEWLEFFQRKDWNDPSVNPDDLAEYSEFQRPYDTDDKSDYPGWEWTWPDINLPGIPPIVYPDPIESPCSIDENCVWAGVIGPDELECDECFTYTQAHVWYGCDVAPWWAAYGSWTLETQTQGGNCYQLFTGPIMTTVCCDDVTTGSFTVIYNGPLECQGQKEVQVTCGKCCQELTLTGSDTVGQSATWTGTISPACVDVECSVTSNSGCSLSCVLNEEGTQVTVSTGVNDCGGFTVTVTGPSSGEECPENSDSKHVRITGGTGDWRFDTTGTALSCGEVAACNADGNCGCGYGSAYPHASCIADNTYRYGLNNGADFDCSQNYGRSCLAGSSCTCTGDWPPCGAGTDCGDPGAACGGGPDYCTARNWHRCEWRCSDAENCS